MWNFTVRELLNPDITGIEDLFSNKETLLESQEKVLDWNADNVQLERYDELSSIWKEYKKKYILSLLHDALNIIPSYAKPLHVMSESDRNQWLSKANYTTQQNNTSTVLPTIDLTTLPYKYVPTVLQQPFAACKSLSPFQESSSFVWDPCAA
jgi:hypothetical protein